MLITRSQELGSRLGQWPDLVAHELCPRALAVGDHLLLVLRGYLLPAILELRVQLAALDRDCHETGDHRAGDPGQRAQHNRSQGRRLLHVRQH